MIRRFGFRHVLPVLLLLIHLTILWWDWEQARHHPVDSGPPLVWDVPKPIPVAMKVAASLNLPALLMSVPFKMAFPATSDNKAIFASIPFVPLVWYGIGLWLDRLTGRVALPRRQHPRLRRIVVITTPILLCISIVSMTPLNHHRGTDPYWTGGRMVLWSTLLLGISATGVVEKRNT
jgi:hypothetical protein